jgi:hypothetical protein
MTVRSCVPAVSDALPHYALSQHRHLDNRGYYHVQVWITMPIVEGQGTESVAANGAWRDRWILSGVATTSKTLTGGGDRASAVRRDTALSKDITTTVAPESGVPGEL